ncbi:MAG: NTP transferase domain-containing protein [Anaerolineaceae bacterium]
MSAGVAGVILAAGESSRFGQPKQLLTFRGKTFIENVIETALNTRVSPIIVILGANSQEILEIIEKYKNRVVIVENPDWQSGQSSSIRIALSAINGKCEAVLFLLVDQPQVSSELIDSLVNHFADFHDQILAPFFGEKRGNPVLFDNTCFSDLKRLTGNQGGRVLFQNHNLSKFDWQDGSILLDVDQPEDYLELVKQYGK